MAKTMGTMMKRLNALGAPGGKAATPAEARAKTVTARKTKKVTKALKAAGANAEDVLLRRLGSQADARTERAAAAVKAKFAEKPAPKAKAALGRGEIAVLVGPYGTESAAAQEAMQYRHPNVFQYRSLFPNPTRYGVKAEVVKAEPVKDPNPTNPLDPYKVRLVIKVTGPGDKAENWVQALRNRASRNLT